MRKRTWKERSAASKHSQDRDSQTCRRLRFFVPSRKHGDLRFPNKRVQHSVRVVPAPSYHPSRVDPIGRGTKERSWHRHLPRHIEDERGLLVKNIRAFPLQLDAEAVELVQHFEKVPGRAGEAIAWLLRAEQAFGVDALPLLDACRWNSASNIASLRR